ncbi:MAG: sporulation protein YqfD [Thermacetogeniaceae bacterium]
MFLRNFWAYILGYLVLVVKGGHPERFINLALTRGVVLWDLVWLDRETLLVKVYAQSFRPLRHIARRANCRIRIRVKRGLPFYLHRLRRRRMLVAGGIIFCIAVYALCSFVWTVDVVGARRISPEAVRRIAAEAGLRPGVLKCQVDGNNVAEHLMQRIPDAAFVEVDVKGRSVIRIGERMVPKSDANPCHIIAKKDGVIESLLVLMGSPQVKEGDVVKKGDVLISGIITPPSGAKSQVRYVAAKGIVRARVWYRSYGEALRSEIKATCKTR